MGNFPHDRHFSADIIPNRLALVAQALFVVYLISVLAVALPPRLLDPLWQLNTIRVIIEAAPIPLLGLALLELAAHLCPQDLGLQRLNSRMSRIAILACLGFLLIVPLQAYAVWKSYRLSNSVADQQQAIASQRAETVRQAIQQASSATDLQRRLLALQRPDLRIQLNSDQFPTIPLPKLKAELLAQLDQAEGQFKLRFARIDPASTERLTRESLRFMVSSAAFAFAFAALAQRKNSTLSFLVEGPSLPGRWLASIRSRGGGSNHSTAGMSHFDAAARREAEYFASLAPPEEHEPPVS